MTPIIDPVLVMMWPAEQKNKNSSSNNESEVYDSYWDPVELYYLLPGIIFTVLSVQDALYSDKVSKVMSLFPLKMFPQNLDKS